MKHLKKSILAIVLILNCISSRADTTRLSAYKLAFDSITSLVQSNDAGAFKKAVFTVENTYLNNAIDYDQLNNEYFRLAAMAYRWAKSNPLRNYAAPDSTQVLYNRAIFQILKDTLKLNVEGNLVSFIPFEYNFDDYDGKKDWANTFVYTLLKTNKGNCHSLPYLYKILADELGTNCWLALAPNHMYVKNYCKQDGWYNTELTSGEFPIDAWLTTTSYITLAAIQSGLYCDTLSNQQSIALCAIDLAKAYEKETNNYSDGFILNCCDLVLKYHPVNPQALLLKAETLKRQYEVKQKTNQESKADFEEMEKLYVHLYDLGYREMPEKMYKEWLQSLKTQKDKYSNKKLSK